MSLVKEYKKILKDGYTKVICSYDMVQGKYNYKPFSHKIDINWENDFTDILLKNLLHYCYYPEELDRFKNCSIRDLEACIRVAIQNRLNKRTGDAKTDGLCGELLIDLILSIENIDYEMLICRPLYQQPNNKAELKSYDLLMFTKSDNGIKLILGQAKTGSYAYCQKGIKEDLNNKYSCTYFGEQVCYIVDKVYSHTRIKNELQKLLEDLNEIIIFNSQPQKLSKQELYKNILKYFEEKEIEIEIPCLLFYDKLDVYKNYMQIENNLLQEIKRVQEHFDLQTFNIFNINYKIIFYVFPTKNVNCLRESLMKYKENILSEVACG